MHSLGNINRMNVERVIQLTLDRAEAEGVALTRDQVLDHMRFSEDEDVSQWEAVVDRLMQERDRGLNPDLRVAA